jgi:radical SAM enzyme (TIGR04100 family)
MSSILYTYENSLYINLTNQCPCACVFCIRDQHEGVGSGGSLWLDQEPTAGQVADQLARCRLPDYSEIIFCGYGEPFCALDTLLEVCRHIHSVSDIKVRINTNGLGDLIHQKKTAPMLEGHVDAVSVSLNAPDARRYQELCRPVFGLEAYDAMLSFITDCKQYVPDVRLTVVDIIPPREIAACRQIARALEVPLRVRQHN